MEKRLLQFIQAENITQAQFADSIGVARASVSHIIAGRNKPGYEFIASMVKAYPSLNAEWLLTGKGKMYKSEQETPPQLPVKQNDGDLFAFDTDLESETQVYGAEAVPEAIVPMNDNSETPRPDIIKQSIASAITPKIIEKQRNVKKIIILFDDGSYQEM